VISTLTTRGMVLVRRFLHRSVGGRQPEAIRACSPGALECKTLQSVSSRRDDAGRNRRHPDGIGAMKLEAAPRYHVFGIEAVQNNATSGPRLPHATGRSAGSLTMEARNRSIAPRTGRLRYVDSSPARRNRTTPNRNGIIHGTAGIPAIKAGRKYHGVELAVRSG